MAERDPLDDALAELSAALDDIGFVINTLQTLRRNAQHLQPALAEELVRFK